MKNICFQMNRKAWLALVMVLCLSFPALAQKITVNGTVSDPAGEPLIGASVLVQGTSNGGQTDIDGNFTLSVDPNATLVVSYVGYHTKNVPVNGQTTINVVLEENSVVLGEVVAIGYGAVKKSDATGSVAVIKPDEIEAGISVSAQDMLVGASPGVVVTTDGGNPVGGATIRIRGGSSLSASNDPLIVLDGVPLSDQGYGGTNPLTMIAPESIESMTVLKDASATAIYGSRASNGVIIITTKKGKAGKPQINFTANMHVNKARNTWDVLSGDEFRTLVSEQIGTASATSQLGSANTNWQDEILRTTVSQDYSLSVGGQAGILPYRVSASYTNNKGILETSEMDRTTVGFNLNPKFFNGLLQINANANGSYIKNRMADQGAIGIALNYNPTLPVYTDYKMGPSKSMTKMFNGYTTLVDAYGAPLANSPNNPVAMLKEVNNTAEVWRSYGNLQVDYALHFLPDLHLNLNLGYDVSKNERVSTTERNSPQSWRGNYMDGAGTIYNHYELQRNTLLEFYANYKKEIESIKSTIDLMAGYSWQRMDFHGREDGGLINTVGYVNNWADIYDGSQYNLLVNPSTLDRIGHRYNDNPAPTPWRGQLNLMSFYGRLNYTLDNKYLLTFTLRDDGTSRFAKDKRWGLFPSLALGWKVSEMDFFEPIKGVMNELKLRLGWGVTGQQSVGGYYPYVATYTWSTSGSVNYPSPDGKDQNWVAPLYPNAQNENIKWEETTTWNVGLDMGFLNNRITAGFDWYVRDTKDLLANVFVPAGMTTTNKMNRNIGELRNVGVEFNIGAKPVVTKNFTWSTGFNVAWNKNELKKLTGSSENDKTEIMDAPGSGNPATQFGKALQVFKVGEPVYSFILYEQVYDENGQPLAGQYVDQNQDGVIDESDLVIKHTPAPDVTFSWNNTFNYKNWDLGIQLRANVGNYVYNAVKASKTNIGTVDRYGLNNLVKNDYYFNDLTGDYLYSDYFLENASFIRCDNITLGYTWKELLDNKLKLRLYGAVQNPFVITDYSGLDPEVFDGIDNNVYPRPVTYTLGLVATF